MMIAIVICQASARAQDEESFEGFVSGIRANAIKGEVFYQRGDEKFELEPGHKLEEGDVVFTGSNSYAELLLQPGNCLRLGAGAELKIASDVPDRVKLMLNHGAVSLEILGKDGEESSRFFETLSQIYQLIRIITPNAEVFVTCPGIFRVNSFNRERTDLIVRDGEAVINGKRVKEKRSGAASRAGVVIAQIDTKIVDGLDGWARERSEEMVQANRVLKKDSPWARNRKAGQETSVDFPKEEEAVKSTRYVVSAKPGTVNFTEPGVQFLRAAKEWEPLTDKSQLETGDRVRTDTHSLAELMMLPDINLRLANDSEVIFEQLSNESISLKLERGSAILDVARFVKEGPQIWFKGTSTSIVIADEGNYRIDAGSNGPTFTVRDGKVLSGDRRVGSCRKIEAGVVSDCDKKRSDNLDFWSDHRGEGKLYNGRDVVSMLAHLDRIRRLRFKNTGFWFQIPGATDYTFIPFSSQRFRSPYGGSYSTVLSPRRVQILRPEFLPAVPTGRAPGPSIARPQP